MAENTLKLCGGLRNSLLSLPDEPPCDKVTYALLTVGVAVPGLSLPKAFEEVERKLESVANLCRMKCSYETQTASLLTVCSDLQRLLKLAFIGTF